LFTGFASLGHAQILTADTIGGAYNYTTGLGSYLQPTDGMNVTQTFTNITSIDTLTVRFGSDSNSFASPIDLNVYFSEWTGSAATSIIGSGTLSLTAPNTWIQEGSAYYYDATIDFSNVAGSLSATSTYGFSIEGSAVSIANNVGVFQGQVAYGSGSVYVHNSGTALTSGADVSHGAVDFAFIGSSIAASSAPFSPVPEASTIAVLFAGLFVGGLAFKRVRDRRQAALVAA